MKLITHLILQQGRHGDLKLIWISLSWGEEINNGYLKMKFQMKWNEEPEYILVCNEAHFPPTFVLVYEVLLLIFRESEI